MYLRIIKVSVHCGLPMHRDHCDQSMHAKKRSKICSMQRHAGHSISLHPMCMAHTEVVENCLMHSVHRIGASNVHRLWCECHDTGRDGANRRLGVSVPYGDLSRTSWITFFLPQSYILIRFGSHKYSTVRKVIERTLQCRLKLCTSKVRLGPRRTTYTDTGSTIVTLRSDSLAMAFTTIVIVQVAFAAVIVETFSLSRHHADRFKVARIIKTTV